MKKISVLTSCAFKLAQELIIPVLSFQLNQFENFCLYLLHSNLSSFSSADSCTITLARNQPSPWPSLSWPITIFIRSPRSTASSSNLSVCKRMIGFVWNKQALWNDAEFGSKEFCEPRHEKTSLMQYANNKDEDQPVHPCSLISIFVIHSLDSI